MQIPGILISGIMHEEKIDALKENLCEKQFFKQIFEDLKKKGNEVNSGIIIPLFLFDVDYATFHIISDHFPIFSL